jgi:transcriptional regulator with XRE-family HTH domain
MKPSFEENTNRMKLLIRQLGVTQAEFARRTGLSASSVSEFVKGTHPITHKAVAKIKKSFENVNADWLLEGQGAMFVSPPTLPEQDQPKKKGRSAGDRAFDAIENNPDLEKILEAMERENERLKGENERQKGIIEYLEKKLEDRGGAPWQDPKGPISAGMDH